MAIPSRDRAGTTFTTAGSLFLAAALTRCPQGLHPRAPSRQHHVLDAVFRRLVRPSGGTALGADQHPQFLVMRGAVSLGATRASAADDRAGPVIGAGGTATTPPSHHARARRPARAAPHRQSRDEGTGAEEVGDRL